ncbi:MAG: hydroxyacid dehydrogenase [Verrucomicrobia bacterium]|nr:hydroxyacid dehydrogenase [Verrucomicrobiota bacterium]
MKILLAVQQEWRDKQIISPRDLARLEKSFQILKTEIPAAVDKLFLLKYVANAEVIVTSWGTSALDAEIMDQAGRLRLVAHAGGSVKPIVSEELWKSGARVTSAAAAIAYGVAEFCLGHILMAPKRTFWAGLATRQGAWHDGLKCFGGPFEIYQQKIGVIGASHVGRHLIRLLQNFTCDILLFDPYCTAEQAEKMGARKVESLDELFTQCRVVSLNAPSTPETRHMIRGRHFAMLPEGAVFINTARAAIIDTAEMISELRRERFVACLDVTDIEPLPANDILRSLPNVWLTPHEAGCVAENLGRLGTLVIDEITSFADHLPLKHEVTKEQLARIG